MLLCNLIYRKDSTQAVDPSEPRLLSTIDIISLLSTFNIYERIFSHVQIHRSSNKVNKNQNFLYFFLSANLLVLKNSANNENLL